MEKSKGGTDHLTADCLSWPESLPERGERVSLLTITIRDAIDYMLRHLHAVTC